MKPTFTNHLKTLMLGGAIALAANQTSQAAAVAGESSVDLRVAKIRQAMESGTADTLAHGQGSAKGDAGMMWWRNAWGNGGWGNWHNF